MKRNIIVFLLLLVAVAANAGNISEEYAARIACKLLNEGIESATAPLCKAHAIGNNDCEQPAYYIFKGGNGQGFVIVSASDATMPILGFSQDGCVDEIPENMRYWLEGMQAQINEIREQGIESTDEIKRQWEEASVGNIKVELSTALWNQGNPFNGECPMIGGKRAVTGCVATAYAILMKYYGSPSHGIGRTKSYYTETQGVYVPSRNLNHTYNWENMPLSYSSYDASQGREVAKLMADIGCAIQIDYTDGETVGYVAKPGITEHFNYASGNHLSRKNYSNLQWHSMLQDELHRESPILYDGGESGSRHAFILDGYTDENYYHVNWGWGGSYNGYFLLDVLSPTSDYNYSANSWALLGFKPMDTVNEEDVVATVDDRLCPDMITAFAIASATHGTITMLKDCNSDELCVWDTENIALDLNGKCLNTTGIFNYGSLVIMDTNGGGKITNSTNDAVVNNYEELTIQSGEYINTATTYDGQYDYRRVIWTAEGSNTVINGGKFTNAAGNQCLCFNGKAVIEDGEFAHNGNGAVVGYYSTSGELIINGGTFSNTATTIDGQSDYRRALWTSEGTNTIINGGSFICMYSPSNLISYGSMTINNADIDTPNGTDCYIRGDCTVKYARMSGKYNISGAGQTIVYEGLFSKRIAESMLAPESSCIANDDISTKVKYPYVVTNSTSGIMETVMDNTTNSEYYNISGQRIMNTERESIVIIRDTKSGNTKKILR